MMPHRPVIIVDPAVPLAHFALAFDVGSLIDPPEKEGTAFLLLRMLKRSVPGMTPTEVDETLDRMGASVGTDVGRSVATIGGGGLTRSWSQLLSLVEKMVISPEFSDEEFQRLRDETLAEWEESLDNDSMLARRVFARHFFTDHPYGRLVGGTPTSLCRITLQDLKDFYPQIFCRDNLHLSFSGDLDKEECERFASNLYNALPPSPRPAPNILDPARVPGRRLVFVDKPERTQTQVLIGCLGTHPRDEDHTALFVGHTAFGGTFSSRLSHEVRGKRGWSYGAYSSLPFDRARQAFTMWTFPQASDAAACIELELQLLSKFVEKGITRRELSATKKYLVNSHAFALDTASKRASLALDEQLYDILPYSTYTERVKAVTLEQVNEAIKMRLSPQDLLITVVGTQADTYGEVQKAIEGLTESEVVSFNQRD